MSKKGRRERIGEKIYAIYRHYGRESDKEVALGIVRRLKEYDEDAVNGALELCLTEGGWTRDKPLLAVILEKLHGTRDEAAALAWNNVRYYITGEKFPVFQDASAHEAAHALGDRYNLKKLSTRELNMLRRQFVDTYKITARGQLAPLTEEAPMVQDGTGKFIPMATVNGRIVPSEGERFALLTACVPDALPAPEREKLVSPEEDWPAEEECAPLPGIDEIMERR